MVEYIFCKNCGKVVDEYESECFWCMKEKKQKEKEEKNGKYDNEQRSIV